MGSTTSNNNNNKANTLPEVYLTTSTIDVEDHPYNVLLVGLEGCGKTTFIHKYKFNQLHSPIASIGFHAETLKTPVKGVTLSLIELSGGKNNLPLWKDYFHHVDGIFYVVDCSESHERIIDASNLLHSVLSDENNHNIPVVIIANKLDLQSQVLPAELATRLNLNKLNQTNNKHFVQNMTAINGVGVNEAVKKMAELIKENKSKSYV